MALLADPTYDKVNPTKIQETDKIYLNLSSNV